MTRADDTPDVAAQEYLPALHGDTPAYAPLALARQALLLNDRAYESLAAHAAPAKRGFALLLIILAALIALIWAALILIKSLSVAHGFSPWRSIGAMALTLLVINVLVPLAGLLAAGYLLRP